MLTVAICTFNRCESLARTLDSIIEAACPVEDELEILVINNNSNDQTSKVIHRFSGKDGRVKEVFEGRQGVAHARNTAIDKAVGEYLVFTDDDVIVDKSWVANMIRVIKEERPACVGGKVLPMWEDEPPDWLGHELFPMLALLDFHASRVRLDIPKVYSNNMCLHRETAIRFRKFRTDRGRLGRQLASGEDTEFVQRLIRNGEKVLYDPAPFVWHRIEKNRMKKSYFRKWRYDTARCTAKYGCPEDHVSSGYAEALTRLARHILSQRLWIGDEKSRLLSQLEFMATAGRIVGLIEQSLSRKERPVSE